MNQQAFIHETVKLGQCVTIHEGVVIHKGAVIGDYTEIKPNVVIGGGVTVGSFCLIAPNVSIVRSQNTWVKYMKKPILKSGKNPVEYVVSVWEPEERVPRIGDHVFIGANTCVNNNVCDNVVIGACSFVKDHIIESGTYQGNPCKKVKDYMAYVHVLQVHV